MADWFSENAPKSGDADWFAKNAPVAPTRPPMDLGDTLMEVAKKFGSAAISPITGIPGAVQEVYDWAKSGFKPPVLGKLDRMRAGTAAPSDMPGEMGSNPLDQALGNAVMVAAPIAGEAAISGAGAAARGASSALKSPGAASLIEGVPETVAGGAMIAHGNLYGVPVAARGVSQVIKGVNEVRRSRAGAPLPEPTQSPKPSNPPPRPGPVRPPLRAPQETPAPSSQLDAEIQSTPQEIAAMPPAEAKAALEATRRGKGITQAMKDSQKLIDKLAEWEFTPDEAKSLNEAGWSRLAHDAGVPVPTGTALKTMKSRVWMGLANKLAGPIKTRTELMNELRASMPKEAAQ